MPDNPIHNPDIEPIVQEFHIPEVEQAEEGDVLYQRQSTLGLYTDTSVSLIGCGGVGVWCALSLALAGVENIDLYDGDTLSIHNLNRYPLPMGFIGEAKSLALAQWLSILRPKGNFQARGEFNPEYHNQHVRNWVICATDSLASRKMAYSSAQDAGASYLEVGADGEGWSLSPNPPEFSTELEGQAGYQVTPVHVGPCMMAGAAAAYYVLHGQVPVDSHVGKWDGQRITLATMPEETFETFTCGMCEFRTSKLGRLIQMIKHVRTAHVPNMSLAEAKALVESWLDDTPVDEIGNMIMRLENVTVREDQNEQEV